MTFLCTRRMISDNVRVKGASCAYYYDCKINVPPQRWKTCDICFEAVGRTIFLSSNLLQPNALRLLCITRPLKHTSFGRFEFVSCTLMFKYLLSGVKCQYLSMCGFKVYLSFIFAHLTVVLTWRPKGILILLCALFLVEAKDMRNLYKDFLIVLDCLTERQRLLTR